LWHAQRKRQQQTKQRQFKKIWVVVVYTNQHAPVRVNELLPILENSLVDLVIALANVRNCKSKSESNIWFGKSFLSITMFHLLALSYTDN
jgi:hypothetical protein